MGRLRTKRYGTRAEVWHGKARMTQGRLIKEDFVMNKYGYIVSKSKSKLMKGKENPLRKKGLLQNKKSKNKSKKGTFGPKKNFLKKSSIKKNKKNFLKKSSIKKNKTKTQNNNKNLVSNNKKK